MSFTPFLNSSFLSIWLEKSYKIWLSTQSDKKPLKTSTKITTSSSNPTTELEII